MDTLTRKTSKEIEATAQAVLVYLRLCPFTYGEDYRWSRTTLFLTQEGWEHKDRCLVWVKSLYTDTATDKPSSQAAQTGQMLERCLTELQNRIREFGNDGGLNGHGERASCH